MAQKRTNKPYKGLNKELLICPLLIEGRVNKDTIAAAIAKIPPVLSGILRKIA
jgi:hypothetical protein